jgi:hypothetical protein
VKENILGFDLVVVELASDRQGLTALLFQIMRRLVTTGMLAVWYEIEAPQKNIRKLAQRL